MEEKIIIRKQQYEDVECCAKLNILVWRDAYKHIFQKQVCEVQKQNISNKIQMFKSGLDDDNILTYVAEINGEIVGEGEGRSKKEAEQAAAGAALGNLNI